MKNGRKATGCGRAKIVLNHQRLAPWERGRVRRSRRGGNPRPWTEVVAAPLLEHLSEAHDLRGRATAPRTPRLTFAHLSCLIFFDRNRVYGWSAVRDHSPRP
jgi:hypothetical protein